MVDNVSRSSAGLGFEHPRLTVSRAVGQIWRPIVMIDRLLPSEK
jgi:hypothetical protein